MATKEQVQSWIQWSRYDLPRTGDYPKINIVEINRVTCSWQEGISDLFERSDRKSQGELLTLFEDQLSRDPGDISSRFTALSLHYALSHYDSILIEDLVEEPRVDFTKNLGYFVRLLPVEECADWPTICWEISNTYAILDWDRASRLYKHLEALGLRDAVKLRVLRGQFNFLVVYDSEFDPIDWEPKIYDSTDAVHEFLIILWGLTEKDKKESNLQEADRDRIYDAANDLEKALNKRSDLSPAYRSLLAKCYFAKQDFHNAAKNYQQLLTILKNHSVFGQSRVVSILKSRVYRAVARSYQLAGEAEKAIDVLNRYANEFPNERGIYEQLAKVQAQEGQSFAAYDSLNKELERNPAFDEDLGISMSLALGNLARQAEQIATKVKSYLRSNPVRFEAIDSLLKVYWSSLVNLDKPAREDWIGGSHLMLSLPADSQLRRVQAEAAANMFAKAVELELKSKVFEKFRDYVSQSPDLRSLAKQEGSLPDCKLFCQFLFKKIPITLGQMHYVLKDCENSKRGILIQFNRWVQKRQSPLLKNLWLLGKICDIRRPAAHESISIEDAERMHGLCRGLLQELLPMSTP